MAAIETIYHFIGLKVSYLSYQGKGLRSTGLPRLVFKESALGRFFHRVAMSVCVGTYVRTCPLPMQFFCVRELLHASLIRELVHAFVALAWSPKNGEVFQIGRITCRNLGM